MGVLCKYCVASGDSEICGVMEGPLSPGPNGNGRMTVLTSVGCAGASMTGTWRSLAENRSIHCGVGQFDQQGNTGGEDRQVHTMESPRLCCEAESFSRTGNIARNKARQDGAPGKAPSHACYLGYNC